MALIQRAHGVVAGGGGSVSFAAPTMPGNCLVLVMAWADATHETLAPDTIHDDSGSNVWDGGSTNTAGGNVDHHVDADGSQAFMISVFNAAAMQTLSFSGWNTGVTLQVWLYELSNVVSADNHALFFYHDHVDNSDDATGGGIATASPVAPSFTSGDGGADGVLNHFFAVASPSAGHASIAAVNTPWTLETVQNGYGAAYMEAVGAADQQARFTNGESAQYCSMYAVLASAGAPTTGNVIVKKVTHPSGSEQGFEFTTNYGDPFTLHDGEQNDSGALGPGTYSAVETPVEGWTTARLARDQDGQIVTIRDPEGSFTLGAGETVTVTFTNTIQKVIVAKATTPPGNLQDFTFHPSWGASFTLQDTGTNDSGRLEPGAYTITEDPVTGWKTSVAAVDQADTPVTIGEDGSFTLESGQIVTITFTNLRCICLDFTEEVIRDANDIEQVVAGGADGKLYLLYDGISDNGKYFTGEALALKYVGPQRTALQSIEWYGEKSAEFFLAKQLNTPFDSSQMAALCGEDSEGVEEVQDDENSNHWRVTIKEQLQMIHAYLLLRLKGYEGGSMELSDPPHMPVETYGRVLLVSPQAGGANPR